MLSLALKMFIIMNPIGSAPIVFKILQGVEPRKRVQVVLQEVTAAIAIMTLFYFSGNSILSSLGVPVAATYLAGSVILGLVAIKTLFPGEQELSASLGLKPGDTPFVVPIALPMLAGAGTLTTLIKMYNDPNKCSNMEFLGSMAILHLMATTVLLGVPMLIKAMGDKLVTAVEKIIGLLLMMFSAAMLLNSIKLFSEML